MQLVEGSGLLPKRECEVVPEEGYLWFGLPGALITKSRNELDGKPCIVVEVDNHYEVWRVRKRIHERQTT